MVDFENDIKNCVINLLQGDTILYPTDTVWGIGCDALNEAAIEKIYTLKQRPKEKSLIILLADARDILKYIAAPPPDIIDMLDNFNKPTTVIYSGALGFPDNALNADGTIAIRVTDDLFCKALIKRYRKPIISTSANISGQPTAAIYKQVAKQIIDNAGYVVQYRQDDETIKQPSQLIRLRDDGSYDVLRA